jgi:hypothetical protein
MALLNDRGIEPVKRQFPGVPERQSLFEAYPEIFADVKPKRRRQAVEYA